tara:strand:- start:71 stop:304 length:234 start_codon:yes stop_codon:yes gene_type:complete
MIKDNYIDLRGVSCPLNFVRCRLFLEKLDFDDLLYVHIDKGEPEDLLIPGLKQEGHEVSIVKSDITWIKLKIVCQSE